MDISKITDYLYIAAQPNFADAEEIRDLGIQLIINMIFRPPAKVYTQLPFQMVTLRSFDSVFLPIPIWKLKKGVMSALPVMKEGNSVLVYCRKGRHRSVAMCAAILIALDYSADEAMKLIKERREVADPYASHIQRVIKTFESEWCNLLASFH